MCYIVPFRAALRFPVLSFPVLSRPVLSCPDPSIHRCKLNRLLNPVYQPSCRLLVIFSCIICFYPSSDDHHYLLIIQLFLHYHFSKMFSTCFLSSQPSLLPFCLDYTHQILIFSLIFKHMLIFLSIHTILFLCLPSACLPCFSFCLSISLLTSLHLL